MLWALAREESAFDPFLEEDAFTETESGNLHNNIIEKAAKTVIPIKYDVNLIKQRVEQEE
jgi:hypothetical protein